MNGACSLIALVGWTLQAGFYEPPTAQPLSQAFAPGGFEGQFEQRYPFDSQDNWVHGYHQEIPAYGGHVFFRPYNYKDVLVHSQTAAGWGMPATMPYSQQFWHRYHDQATMLKLSRMNRSEPAAAYGWAVGAIPQLGTIPLGTTASFMPPAQPSSSWHATPQHVIPAGNPSAPWGPSSSSPSIPSGWTTTRPY
ncbi:MAG: hypothetical protein KatS3mg113_0229 [Planctomycetaceae bacterium]|nr:MAG: hypothetical protein KatS3mg113_0229 [Planctomycetaceae bacterium]